MRWRSNSHKPDMRSRRWLCLDPGDRRTGVAISSPEGTFAIPVAVLEHERGGPSPEAVEELLREHGADALLIGLPLSMDGSASSQTTSTLALAQRIAAHFRTSPNLPPGVELPHDPDVPDLYGVRAHGCRAGMSVQLWDERLSSWDAKRAMELGGTERRSRRGKKPAIDAHAATVILQSFLSTRQGEPPPRRDPTTDTTFGARTYD